MAFSNAITAIKNSLNAVVVNSNNLFEFEDNQIRDLTEDGTGAMGFDGAYLLRYEGGGAAFEEIVSHTGTQEARSRFSLQIGTDFTQDPSTHYQTVEERGQKAWSALVTSKEPGHLIAVLPLGEPDRAELADRRTVWTQEFEMLYKV